MSRALENEIARLEKMIERKRNEVKEHEEMIKTLRLIQQPK